MKRLLFLVIVLLCFFDCAQEKLPLLGDTDYQRAVNAKFKDAKQTPLTEVDLRTFRGLDFFKFDSAYVVTASFKRTPEALPFQMKTTTNRVEDYVKYGEVAFLLKSKQLKLNLYQKADLIGTKTEKEDLFLPFMDNSNGNQTYKGGRYVDVKLEVNNQVVIDFNAAYNPYCAYNKKYSCPIVPKENILYVSIASGEKKY